jgi:hypothetical protein
MPRPQSNVFKSDAECAAVVHYLRMNSNSSTMATSLTNGILNMQRVASALADLRKRRTCGHS